MRRQAGIGLPAGADCTVCYGELNNADLALTYGFVLTGTSQSGL